MVKIIINESQLKSILETGSNSVAMDLDHYTREMDHPNGKQNLNFVESAEDSISKLRELLNVAKSGKNLDTITKSQIFKVFDLINKIHNSVMSKP